MRLQRVRVAESRIEMQIVKWTAEGMVKGVEPSIPWRDAYVSCEGYVSILQRVRIILWSANQGGTADSLLFVLDKVSNFVKDFLRSQTNQI